MLKATHSADEWIKNNNLTEEEKIKLQELRLLRKQEKKQNNTSFKVKFSKTQKQRLFQLALIESNRLTKKEVDEFMKLQDTSYKDVDLDKEIRRFSLLVVLILGREEGKSYADIASMSHDERNKTQQSTYATITRRVAETSEKILSKILDGELEPIN